MIDRRSFLLTVPALAYAPRLIAQGGAPFRATGLSQLTLTVSDVGKSLDFYQGLFGMPVQARQGSTVLLRIGAGPKFLELRPAAAGERPSISALGFAVERFDIDREIKFETYAITRIKGAIIDELRSLDWVPRSVRARAREIERVHGKLEHRLHRTPTDEEMARELSLSVEEFQESLVKISNSTVVALDELWAVSDSSGDQVSLLDTLHDPDAPDPQQLLKGMR